MAIPKNARTVKVSEVDQDTARKNVEVIGKDQDAPLFVDATETIILDNITDYWKEGEFAFLGAEAVAIPKNARTVEVPKEESKKKVSKPPKWTISAPDWNAFLWESLKTNFGTFTEKDETLVGSTTYTPEQYAYLKCQCGAAWQREVKKEAVEGEPFALAPGTTPYCYTVENSGHPDKCTFIQPFLEVWLPGEKKPFVVKNYHKHVQFHSWEKE